MNNYQYPLEDAEFVLNELLEIDKYAKEYDSEGLDPDFMSTVLSESAKFCEGVVAPLNWSGDQEGAALDSGAVTSASGFKEAYSQYALNGWTSLTGNVDYGGQGLPHLMGTACNEILQSANLAFSLNPLLTAGAIDAIDAHASDDLKQTYLPSMIAGTWTGTMNLTEPDAGSDLAAIKTKAEPQGDHFLISGQKIFITWGEHDMSENIIHLVLARLPDAPAGVKGISLFLVPKFLLDDQGQPSLRNDLSCVSLEHKLGIHASPTCVMAFGEQEGAVGYLVGEANQGLACMFTMMNSARQGVGLQGLAIAERAYQQAKAYANDRLQGTKGDGSRFTIVKYADVRRMLMLQKSALEAMRALAYEAAFESDKYHFSKDEFHLRRLELFTPIVKAWMTEMAQELTSLAVQIHGGMGFIEETGAAQHMRDARILTIYEGTTAIQGNDLIGRKILMDRGGALIQLLDHMHDDVKNVDSALVNEQTLFFSALDDVRECLAWVLVKAEDRQVANAVGTNMALMLGNLCGAWLMLKSALKCQSRNDEFARNKIVTAKFYFAHWLPRVNALKASVMSGDQFLNADLS